MMNNMFFESKSKYAFDETVEKLSNIIVEAGWRVTHTHDLKETMRKNGFDVLPAKVIELCNPGYAYRILSADELRIYGNMMPCRISVHEKADGKTYVSRMNSALFASQIGGVPEEVMSDAYRDAEGFVAQIAE
ncbi:MAG TPA: DUF302 domain-containing protein [Petrimonas sp.]|uniref:DUF302 domain-containing protein n=1 Tax=Petrimonas sp. TaxID=2023866 RepID=UPI0009618E24|nr:DUF302 domain-containing protein [Petrimonas sp.]MEA5046038.1 DUF302 domain-containing protein [Petrimonas sp.]MEA5062014.1 DUF302 domain-containing protein [Petrimonas sp.]OJV36773.1 MAG: hypothetical protein BGO33_04430 [Bacteroidia bacterium 43-41]HHV85587.1 DUF302 domain-containing protein [Petrimonas sp.]